MWRHRRTWLTTRWSRREREREAALAAAREHEERERRAAVRRILEQATTALPAVAVRRAPLLTRGQAERSQRL